MEHLYQFEESGEIVTPALIYYRDMIRENIEKTLALTNGAKHLWPHIKTHKMADMVRLLMEYGITRFKCATIAEAETAASCGASDVLVAYPLVGPNIRRFLQLNHAYPSVRFWAIGDNKEQLAFLGQMFAGDGKKARVLVDMNLGMNRTGVKPEDAVSFYTDCAGLDGIEMKGLHCYDGHRTETDFSVRKSKAEVSAEQVKELCSALRAQGIPCEILILGGTPSTPCYTEFAVETASVFVSPGTLFINDYGYTKKFPDLKFPPAAAILTRVISCPAKGHFTLDLGYKAIASDPEGTRGIIAGMEHVRELFQSEEHWAFCMEPGYEEQCPKVGDELFVVPTHICPTSALYPSVPVIENKRICAVWNVTARNRKITY